MDFDSREDCEFLARWYNDPEIKHLYSRFTDVDGFSMDFTPEYFPRAVALNEGPQAALKARFGKTVRA